jgi:hypothetical protein
VISGWQVVALPFLCASAYLAYYAIPDHTVRASAYYVATGLLAIVLARIVRNGIGALMPNASTASRAVVAVTLMWAELEAWQHAACGTILWRGWQQGVDLCRQVITVDWYIAACSLLVAAAIVWRGPPCQIQR